MVAQVVLVVNTVVQVVQDWHGRHGSGQGHGSGMAVDGGVQVVRWTWYWAWEYSTITLDMVVGVGVQVVLYSHVHYHVLGMVLGVGVQYNNTGHGSWCGGTGCTIEATKKSSYLSRHSPVLQTDITVPLPLP